MDLLGTANEPHAGHAVAPAVERTFGGGDDTRVVGQAEVIVGAEVEDLPVARHLDTGLLGREDDTLGLKEPCRADFFQLGLELVADLREHGGPPVRLRTR